ncbi:protein amnionless [Fopius arisanus]|uniref:Protein amnionless n=1 Tax=Fopius arisanus TaxID=64838 RepID=A0A9R1SVV2_9HYME|nr:PREDICTED: protein amnionless-like [Fopius arisanus]
MYMWLNKSTKMRHKILFCFLTTFCINKGDSWGLGGRKVWLPDLEFTTRNNWINNKVPTRNSRIQFPVEMQHSVGLPVTGDFIFSGIELPHDGSLLLPLNGGLQLTEAKGRGNNPEIFAWKWKGPFSWVDPDNWSGSNKAVPHLERIPCGTDMVILPNYNRSLSIKLPTVTVNIKEIKIGNETPLEAWDWQSIMMGREFSNNHQSVLYSGLPYCDTDKCLCRHNTDVKELINEICEIESSRCSGEEIPCSYPLVVEGHCCSYCGGRVSLNVDHTTFSLSKLHEITTEALKNYHDILQHIRVTLDGNVEVLVTESVYRGIKSAEAVDTLQRAFAERGINVVSYAVTGAPLKGSVIATALGPLFGVPLVLIVLILIAIPAFGYSYREVYFVFRTSIREGNLPPDPSKEGDFGFARFENVAEGDVQLASALIPEDETDSDDDDYKDGKRFDNPLYRSKRKEPVENIIDIDGPVSLAALEDKVNLHEETNIDSD